MAYEKITLGMLNEMLYVNEDLPILRRSFGRLKNYDFLHRFIPPRLLEYKNEIYDTAKIWGKKHNKSSLSKLINKEFVPKLFYEQIFNLLYQEKELLTEIQKNFQQEWLRSQGDIYRLLETLKQMNEFHEENFGQEWVNYVYHDNSAPEIILTLLMLYSILSEKALLLYPCPVKENLLQEENQTPETEGIKTNLLSTNFLYAKNLQEKNLQVEEYVLIYYSAVTHTEEHLIYSKLTIDPAAGAKFYNNYAREISSWEYAYEGTCIPTSYGLILNMKNVDSDEYITISLIKSAGNFQRYLGLILALSAGRTPVCVKAACFSEVDFEKVNLGILYKVLHSENLAFRHNLLAYEENAKTLFFSDSIFES